MCKHILFNDFSLEQDLETLKDFVLKTDENDGYGAIFRYKDGSITSLKSVNQGEFYLEVYPMLQDSRLDTVVVHHRTSTNSFGIKNAHPFYFKGYYLTHNGVVSVPRKYVTETDNDSEQLLHHLITTDYSTKDISGYFSVFLVSQDLVQVIVDGTAPIYTDGRVYSSHKLKSEYTKIEYSHVLIQDGRIETKKIEVSKSSYGMDKAHLSLGTEYSDYRYDDDDNVLDFYKHDSDKQIADFFACLTNYEDDYFFSIRDRHRLIKKVYEKSCELGFWLTDEQILQIVDIYSEVG